LDGYNSTPHSSTGIAPNDINEENEGTAYINMKRKSKTKPYDKIRIGDTVRIPVTHKVEKGYKQQWSYELHEVEDVFKNGVYQVNGDLYPRKELQLVKGEVRKQPKVSEKEIEKKKEKDRIGKAQNIPEIKELTGKINQKEAGLLFEPRMTRSQLKEEEEKKNKRLGIDSSNIIDEPRRRR